MTYIQMDRQTNVQTNKQTDRGTETHTDRLTDRQTYIKIKINILKIHKHNPGRLR